MTFAINNNCSLFIILVCYNDMGEGGGGEHLFTSQLIKIEINTKKQQLIIIDTKQEILLFNKYSAIEFTNL